MINSSIYSLIGGAPITPSDSTVLSDVRAIYVAGTGDVAVRMAADGAVLVLKGVPGGTLLPLQVDRVMAAGTTATFLVGFR